MEGNEGMKGRGSGDELRAKGRGGKGINERGTGRELRGREAGWN